MPFPQMSIDSVLNFLKLPYIKIRDQTFLIRNGYKPEIILKYLKLFVGWELREKFVIGVFIGNVPSFRQVTLEWRSH